MDALTTYTSDAQYSIRSVGNSTSSPLSGGATFTGSAEQNPYPEVFIDVRTNADCTVYSEFSVDGSNWTRFPVNGFRLSSLNNWTAVSVAVKADRYFRLVIDNGASAQGFLRASVSYGVFGQLNSPLNQSYSLQSSSILTRNSWTWLDVARGLASGVRSIKKFGRNSSVGTSFVPVALGGFYRTPQGASATALRIKAGGDANDSAAGSGARSVTLIGLDQNFDYAEETIATNGASASLATTTLFTRLYRAFVSASGTYATSSAGSHAGQIVIENSGGGTDWATIGATNFPKSQTEIGAYSTARDKTAYVKLRNLSVDSGKTIDLVFFSRANIDESSPPYTAMRSQSVVSGVSGGSIEVFGDTDVPFGPYHGPHDFGFMAKVSSGTASVSVEFEIIEVDE